MVTSAPAAPEDGERLEMLGGATTVKLVPVLETPETVTTTFPVVAPEGTGATILESVQLVGVAEVPLNLTVLVPWVFPKFVPVIVIESPTIPEFGEMFVIAGVVRTVKLFPLLSTPLA
jgi:hypothetical protein